MPCYWGIGKGKGTWVAILGPWYTTRASGWSWYLGSTNRSFKCNDSLDNEEDISSWASANGFSRGSSSLFSLFGSSIWGLNKTNGSS